MMLWVTDAWCADPEVDAVLAVFAAEPTVQQVQRWAAEAVEARPAQIRRWLSTARRAAWLPEVGLDVRVRDDWDQGFVYLGSDGGVPAPGVAVVPIAEDGTTALAREARLSLRWQLSELVVSSELVRLTSVVSDLTELREQTCAEVTRLYFERRRAQVEVLLAPASATAQRVADQLRIDELTASIDALTDGAFSAAMDRAHDAG